MEAFRWQTNLGLPNFICDFHGGNDLVVSQNRSEKCVHMCSRFSSHRKWQRNEIREVKKFENDSGILKGLNLVDEPCWGHCLQISFISIDIRFHFHSYFYFLFLFFWSNRLTRLPKPKEKGSQVKFEYIKEN